MTYTQKADIITDVSKRIVEEIEKKKTEYNLKANATNSTILKVSYLHQVIGYGEAQMIAIKVRQQMLKEINEKQEDELIKIINKKIEENEN